MHTNTQQTFFPLESNRRHFIEPCVKQIIHIFFRVFLHSVHMENMEDAIFQLSTAFVIFICQNLAEQYCSRSDTYYIYFDSL